MRDAVPIRAAAFVDYLWPQPGKDEPVAKLAYAEGFARGAGLSPLACIWTTSTLRSATMR